MPNDPSQARHYRSDVADTPWLILLLIGAALLVAGGTDVLLLFFPVKFGDLEWEFGTASALFNGLPVPAMGAALLLAAGVATERLGAVAVALLWSVMMTVLLLGALTLYVLNIPLALRSVGDQVARGAMISAVVKGLASASAYIALHCAMGYISARFVRHK